MHIRTRMWHQHLRKRHPHQQTIDAGLPMAHVVPAAVRETPTSAVTTADLVVGYMTPTQGKSAIYPWRFECTSPSLVTDCMTPAVNTKWPSRIYQRVLIVRRLLATASSVSETCKRDGGDPRHDGHVASIDGKGKAVKLPDVSQKVLCRASLRCQGAR